MPATLARRFGLLQATALNMINVIGIGPFVTIPLLMTPLGGPQAMLGWLIALVIVICDGMVRSELGAAMPRSGGSFGYLREALGRETVGRLMAFLFVWQFILSGPLEIASGYVGFSHHFGYIWPRLTGPLAIIVIAAIGALNIALLYHDVCCIGDEVKKPGRVIPRSILISTIAVALICFGINLAIIGVVPWREFVPAGAHPQSSFIVSIFMERVYGSGIATIFTLMILRTAFGSVFALLLGYSGVPYAAAREGYFFPVFGRLHATKHFPYISLLVVGTLAIVAGLFPLAIVIDALIAMPILVQFGGQVVAVVRLRRTQPNLARPDGICLYPIPAAVALFGWLFVFLTTDVRVIAFGATILALGIVCFLIRSSSIGSWPFARPAAVRRI